MLYSSDEAYKKLIECEKGNTMMHRDCMSKRQEVRAGLLDNTLSSHPGQHFKPKSWIIKCISRVISYHAKTKMPWIEGRIYAVSLSFTGNRRNNYRKMSNSAKVLSTLRRMAKPAATTGRMGFCVPGGIPTAFLGPRTLTPSPSHGQHRASAPATSARSMCFPQRERGHDGAL